MPTFYTKSESRTTKIIKKRERKMIDRHRIVAGGIPSLSETLDEKCHESVLINLFVVNWKRFE